MGTHTSPLLKFIFMALNYRSPGFYLVAFSLVSIILLCLEPLFYAGKFSDRLYFYAQVRLVVTIILVTIDAYLLYRWSKNPDNKSLAATTASVNIILFILGDITVASSTMAVALWVVLRTFNMRACWIIVTAFVMIEPPTLRVIKNESLLDMFWRAVIMCILLVLYLLLAWVLSSFEEAAERERKLAVAAAVDNERSEAARMLHDGIGQQLVAITMSFDVAKALKTTKEHDAWMEVDHAHTVATQALRDLRRWVRALDPPPAPVPEDSMQLVTVLESLSQAFASTGLEFYIQGPQAKHHLGATAGEIFQVTAREGLSNALRHGHPEALQFTLRCTDDAATLTVEDFSTSLQRSIPVESKDEGYGLRSLRERAEQAGGMLHAEPTTEGFFLGVSLPLTESV